jgi:hypothetical protein
MSVHPHVLCKGLYFDYGTGDRLNLDGKGYVCAARHGLLQPDGGAAGAGALLSAGQLRARYGRRPSTPRFLARGAPFTTKES